MHIRAEVTEVSTNGNTLTVKMQGRGKRDASWRRYGHFEIQIPATKSNGRAYYVGRIVRLKITT
jgi:hypothetical protein